MDARKLAMTAFISRFDRDHQMSCINSPGGAPDEQACRDPAVENLIAAIVRN